jgi:hypothetical protein
MLVFDYLDQLPEDDSETKQEKPIFQRVLPLSRNKSSNRVFPTIIVSFSLMYTKDALDWRLFSQQRGRKTNPPEWQSQRGSNRLLQGSVYQFSVSQKRR